MAEILHANPRDATEVGFEPSAWGVGDPAHCHHATHSVPRTLIMHLSRDRDSVWNTSYYSWLVTRPEEFRKEELMVSQPGKEPRAVPEHAPAQHAG